MTIILLSSFYEIFSYQLQTGYELKSKIYFTIRSLTIKNFSIWPEQTD